MEHVFFISPVLEYLKEMGLKHIPYRKGEQKINYYSLGPNLCDSFSFVSPKKNDAFL